MSTRIVAVVNQDTSTAYAESWGRPNSILFEITEGPHAGKRGPDTEIADLVGEIQWDKETVSIRETGQHLPTWMVSNQI